jgi:hypothetical protein
VISKTLISLARKNEEATKNVALSSPVSLLKARPKQPATLLAFELALVKTEMSEQDGPKWL